MDMKKRLTYLLATAAAVSAFSWGTVSLANESASISGPASTSNNNEAKQYFFTIEPKNSKFSLLPNKTYQLIISKKDISNIEAVSTRSHREAYNLTPEEYAKIIHTGKDSFDVVPPNLSIFFADLKRGPISFAVISYKLDEKNITFNLAVLSPQKNIPSYASGYLGIWIDDKSIVGVAESATGITGYPGY